ncbi:MAG TPA: TadG family pilus assembly protein [Sphingomonas sp.]|nr:TadG family pilus assembly protein [Sphingomonas sp.]
MIRRLRKDRRGGVTLIAAGSMIALMATTAFAVEMGSVYLAQRRLQGGTDAAALAAGRPADASAAAAATLAANGLADARLLSAEPGSYTPDASLDAGQRFAPGGSPDNAVRVTASQAVPLYFGRVITGRDSVTVTAHATAARVDLAAFSIGSRLAQVQGGLPNALLSGLIGTNLNLSVMDYNALVGAHVGLLAFASALRTRLDLAAASYGETLATRASLPTILSALADASGDPAAAATLRDLALRVPPTMLRLSDLIDLGPYAGQDNAPAGGGPSVDAYSALQALLQFAGGNRQVSLDLGLALPGLTSTKLTLAIGQRPAHSPWLAVARDGGVIVRTAQARLYLESQIGGIATLGLASLRLPIYVELASAQAKLKAIACSHGASDASVTLSVQPGVGHVAIADLDTSALSDFSREPAEQRAVIARALLLTVTGQADIALGGSDWQDVDFSSEDVAAHRIRTVSTNDLTQGVASSLVRGLDLRVAGLNASLVTGLVGQALTPVSPALDGLLDQIEGLLGIHVGQADVSVDGVRCGQPALVA